MFIFMDISNLNYFLNYLKVNVESCRISCSHNHETLDFGICESWPHWVDNRVKSWSLIVIYFDVDNYFSKDNGKHRKKVTRFHCKTTQILVIFYVIAQYAASICVINLTWNRIYY